MCRFKVRCLLTPPIADALCLRHTALPRQGRLLRDTGACLGRGGSAILKGWAVDGLPRVSSARPINVTIGQVSPVFGRYETQPDIVSGPPYRLAAPTQPGGKY
jgi:hypothetical protein